MKPAASTNWVVVTLLLTVLATLLLPAHSEKGALALLQESVKEPPKMHDSRGNPVTVPKNGGKSSFTVDKPTTVKVTSAKQPRKRTVPTRSPDQTPTDPAKEAKLGVAPTVKRVNWHAHRVLAENKPSRVVLSFSTIPSRLPHLRKTIQSLKRQTYQPDAIYLNLPRESRREKVPYDPPPYIRTDPNITIVWSEDDYGPGTKLIPAVQKEKDPNTLIITVDDDMSLRPTVVATLVYFSSLYPDAALGFTGWNTSCITMKGCQADFVRQKPPTYLFIRQAAATSCQVIVHLAALKTQPSLSASVRCTSKRSRTLLGCSERWASGH